MSHERIPAASATTASKDGRELVSRFLTGGYVGCETQTDAARQLLYMGEDEGSLEQLAHSVNAGFHQARWFDTDPWFESVRTQPAFVEIAAQARRESELSHEAFVAARGNELLARYEV